MPDEFLRCPRCSSDDFFRSRSRSWKEKAFRTLLPLRMYRCHACDWRGLRMSVESRQRWRRSAVRWIGPTVIALLVASLFAFFVMDGARQIQSAARSHAAAKK